MGFLITYLLRLQDFAIDSKPQIISISKSQFAKLIKNGPPKLKWTRFQYNGWLMMLHSGLQKFLYIVTLFSLHHRAMYIVGTTSAKWVVWVWTSSFLMTSTIINWMFWEFWNLDPPISFVFSSWLRWETRVF